MLAWGKKPCSTTPLLGGILPPPLSRYLRFQVINKSYAACLHAGCSARNSLSLSLSPPGTLSFLLSLAHCTSHQLNHLQPPLMEASILIESLSFSRARSHNRDPPPALSPPSTSHQPRLSAQSDKKNIMGHTECLAVRRTPKSIPSDMHPPPRHSRLSSFTPLRRRRAVTLSVHPRSLLLLTINPPPAPAPPCHSLLCRIGAYANATFWAASHIEKGIENQLIEGLMLHTPCPWA